MLFFFFHAVVYVRGQIKVVSPRTLADKFIEGPRGTIAGSTATFGAPYYGERVLGRMIFSEPVSSTHPHCTKEGYTDWEDLQRAVNATELIVENKESTKKRDELKRIFVVKRSGCSFVRKVKVAEEEFNAHAVIVVDRDDSPLRSETIQTIIMADDGFGANIRIPSILISKEDGNILIETYRALQPSRNHDDILLELEWDVPSNDVVVMDMWMSSSSIVANDFLKEFKPIGESLSMNLQFIPHYDIYDLDANDFNEFCYTIGNTKRYCAEDPDMHGPITGAEVVEEDLRQICIWEVTAEQQQKGETEDEKKSPDVFVPDAPDVINVIHSKPYWEYVTQLLDACPLYGYEKKDVMRFGQAVCAEKLMGSLSIDVELVNDCMVHLGTQLLDHQIQNVAWAPLAIRINGWRYAGNFEKDLVAKAICSGYNVAPTECSNLENPIYADSSWSWSRILWYSLGSAAFVILLVILYWKKCFHKYFRRALQEEVMLEVQSAMADYKMLQEDELYPSDKKPNGATRLGRLPRWS